jgi:hypothetical protein
LGIEKVNNLCLAIFVEAGELTASYNRRGKTASNFPPPHDLQIRGQFVEGGRIGGSVSVAPWTKPLRPIPST